MEAEARTETQTEDSTDPHGSPITRAGLPTAMFRRRPGLFLAKFTFAMALVGACWAAIALMASIPVTILAIVVVGLLYAHLVELQHECLHHHAFRSRRLNRAFGFVCGIFLLSGYSHYRYAHLAHHANLGTPENREFFNYRFRDLDSVHGLLFAALHPGRYGEVLRAAWRTTTVRPVEPTWTRRENRKVAVEYLGMCVVVVVAVVASIAAGLPELLLLAWVVPALLIGEPAHFLIEMPEHYGLDTQTDPDVESNTRTIEAGWLGRWYTNLNNLHTAHHRHTGVPMAQARRLHRATAESCLVVEPSYWSFYRKVVGGQLGYEDWTKTCMTR